MRHLISVVWQAVVLYIAAFAGFVAGMTVPAVRVSRVVSQTATSVRTYDYDWLIAALLMYVVLLLIGVARKRIRQSWIATTIALVLTVAVVLLFTQLGVKESAI
ncbi:MAG: hypothetical protein ACRYGF_10315 [Janthinobacterium lividum]